MKWTHAIAWGVILAFILPLAFGGRDGMWANSWASWGTIKPFKQSPGLLFSIPLAIAAAIGFRRFFSWHS